MLDKNPLTDYNYITYAWVIWLAVWGGIVNFWHKLKTGKARAFNVTEFIGEIVTSGFVGVLTFWLCEAGGISPLMTAVFVAISGHMGARAIFLFEKIMENRFSVEKT